jgi:hypothetical protein
MFRGVYRVMVWPLGAMAGLGVVFVLLMALQPKLSLAGVGARPVLPAWLLGGRGPTAMGRELVAVAVVLLPCWIALVVAYRRTRWERARRDYQRALRRAYAAAPQERRRERRRVSRDGVPKVQAAMRFVYVFWRWVFGVCAYIEAVVGIGVPAHWNPPAVLLKVSFGFMAVFVVWVVLLVSWRVQFPEERRQLAAAAAWQAERRAEERRRWESMSPEERENELAKERVEAERAAAEHRTFEILEEQRRLAERAAMNRQIF